MSDLKLKISANYPNPPFFYTKGDNDIINGLDYHLIKSISRHLNISYEFFHANWEWGRQVNGTWIGMIGYIVNNSADLALGELTANTERSKVVDFTIPYFYTDITFVMRMTKKSSINANSLLIEPFDTRVWICLLFTILFSSALMKLMREEVGTTLLIVIRGLLQQGTPFIRRSLRFYSAVWFLFGLILSCGYASMIFLYMSELIPRPEISSITELAIAVKNKRYIPSTSSVGSLFKLIKDIKSSPLNSIGEALLPMTKTGTALKMMLSNMSQLIYICPRLLINGRTASYGPQYLYLPPESDRSSFLMEQLTIAIPKNFTLKNKINKLTLESGAHLYHWKRISMKETSNLKNRLEVNFKLEEPTEGLNLNILQFIFFLLFLGLILSISLLICELINKNILNKRLPNLLSHRFLKQRAYSEPTERRRLKNFPRIYRLHTG